jgi:tripartite-type tricarboxylate transporter receptor subunit TctC
MLSRRVILGATAALVASGAAHAQDFPSKRVTLIAPFPAGGTTDTLARLFAQKISEAWKVPVIVLNKPGAGTIIGLDLAAKSEPDGYTVVLGGTSIATLPHLYEKLPFDPARDLTYISIAANYPLALAVNSRLPVSTLPELIAYARQRPGKLSFASAGSGTTVHLGVELLKTLAGVHLVHIPYPGSSAAMMACASGEVEVVLDTVFAEQPLIQSGKIKPIFVGSAKRLEAFPNVPTAAETYPGFLLSSWLGFMGPAKMPREVTAKWAQAIAQVVSSPDVQKQLQFSGAEPASNTPEEFLKLVQYETARYGKVVASAKIPKIQ